MRHPYRAEVIGSLLRPAYLKDARRRHAAGSHTDAELKRAEDRAVDDAVRIQARAGVSVLTDGEMRRYAYFGHFIDSIEGFDKFGGWAIPFRDEQGDEFLFQRAVVVSRLRRRRRPRRP
jgi:5-methyltetrahydropteroyltriglutamate--homocysteine methyltransferase